jgi:hypothetical protein
MAGGGEPGVRVDRCPNLKQPLFGGSVKAKAVYLMAGFFAGVSKFDPAPGREKFGDRVPIT